ncbi:MAG: hypothetical protein J5817_11315 [Treponema sp.]|nr:hypothetical protein [Treponema sp.]
METSYGIAVMALLFILILIAFKWRRKIIQDTIKEFSEKPYSYTLVIHGEDENAVADKVIVNAGPSLSSFTKEDFNPQSFTVTVRDGDKSAVRKATNAYPCDIDGNKTECNSEEDNATKEEQSLTHFALELESNTGSSLEHPFVKSGKESSKNDSAETQCKNKENYEYSISHQKLPQPVTLCNDWWWQS